MGARSVTPATGRACEQRRRVLACRARCLITQRDAVNRTLWETWMRGAAGGGVLGWRWAVLAAATPAVSVAGDPPISLTARITYADQHRGEASGAVVSAFPGSSSSNIRLPA